MSGCRLPESSCDRSRTRTSPATSETNSSSNEAIFCRVSNDTASRIAAFDLSPVRFRPNAVATLRDNSIRHNGATGVSVLSAPAVVTLTRNELTANAGAGFLAVGGSSVLEGNTISRTTILESTGQGEGLLFLNGAMAELSDNTLTDNTRNGVLLMALSSAVMSDNEIRGSGRYGVECLGAYAELVKGNVLQDNAQGRTVGCSPRP